MVDVLPERLDHSALDAALDAPGPAFRETIAVEHDHLFASVPLFITKSQLQQMREVIESVERVVKLPGWHALSGPITGAGTEGRRECLGVFFGYDFHLNAQGAHLIEINTNAGGAFLNALLIASQHEVKLPGKIVAVDHLEQKIGRAHV